MKENQRGYLKETWDILQTTVQEFLDDDCLSKAAALAYYTIFSLPALLLIIITAVAIVVQRQDAEQGLLQQIHELVGPAGAEAAGTMIQNATRPGAGAVATIVGVVVLLIGATGVMAQLQSTLNEIWQVEPHPDRSVIKRYLLKRVLSFAMILAIAFLLLVSLVVSTALFALSQYLSGLVASGALHVVVVVLNALVSFGVVMLLFAAMFKVLPDVKIAWRDVWVGAAVTALLFIVGKFLIGLYLGSSGVSSAYGAAGSLVLFLVWIYYSALIFLVGAEFTQVWAQRSGQPIEPADGAVRVAREIRRGDEAGAASPG